MAHSQLKRTLEIATPGTRLSVRYEQLVVDRPNRDRITVPIEEVGVIVLDESRCTLTQSVLSKLAEACASLITCDLTHHPVGLLLPLGSHSSIVAVQRTQLNVTVPQKKRIWQNIVKTKIRIQGLVLKQFCGHDHGLSRMANKVLSGDTTNVEARAAQKYWRTLFGTKFKRDRKAEDLNALLNYGYAVVRASIARNIVAAGLIPSIGLHHHNRSNAFCLADDLIEPFRPFVDVCVKQISMSREIEEGSASLECRVTRAKLLNILAEPISLDDVVTPLGLATYHTVQSLRACYDEPSRELTLPTGILYSNSDTEPSPLPQPKRVNSHRRRKRSAA